MKPLIDSYIADQNCEAIRSAFLANVKAVSGRQAVVYAMAGVPGAGKTTFVRARLADSTFPVSAFLLSPDLVMESLPGYRNTLQEKGAAAAFQEWEQPARALAYELLEEAVALRGDIIIDMGAARPEHYQLLADLKHNHGYRVVMYWLEVPAELALARIQDRARHTPQDMVIERAAALGRLKEWYERLAEEFHLVNSNQWT